jgi:hypothetical protein
MSHLLQASQVLARPDGMQLIGMALEIAAGAARCDIELDCNAFSDEHGNWFDTSATPFEGNCENDIEFRQMLDRSILFLDQYGLLERHPVAHHCVRFPEVP